MLGRRTACDGHGVVLSRSSVSDIRSPISSSTDMVSASTSWREGALGIYPMRFCRTNNSSCERVPLLSFPPWIVQHCRKSGSVHLDILSCYRFYLSWKEWFPDTEHWFGYSLHLQGWVHAKPIEMQRFEQFTALIIINFHITTWESIHDACTFQSGQMNSGNLLLEALHSEALLCSLKWKLHKSWSQCVVKLSSMCFQLPVATHTVPHCSILGPPCIFVVHVIVFFNKA